MTPEMLYCQPCFIGYCSFEEGGCEEEGRRLNEIASRRLDEQILQNEDIPGFCRLVQANCESDICGGGLWCPTLRPICDLTFWNPTEDECAKYVAEAEQAARAQLKGELEKVQAQLKRAGVQINELQVRCRLLSPAPAVCAHMPRCPLPRRRRHPPWRTMRPCKSASLSALLRKLCKTRMQPPKQRSCPRTW